MTLRGRWQWRTLLYYEVHAQVGGKIAQLGARLIDASAKQMADAFFDRFSREVAPPPLAHTCRRNRMSNRGPRQHHSRCHPLRSARSRWCRVSRSACRCVAWIGGAIYLFMLLLILGSML